MKIPARSRLLAALLPALLALPACDLNANDDGELCEADDQGPWAYDEVTPSGKSIKDVIDLANATSSASLRHDGATSELLFNVSYKDGEPSLISGFDSDCTPLGHQLVIPASVQLVSYDGLFDEVMELSLEQATYDETIRFYSGRGLPLAEVEGSFTPPEGFDPAAYDEVTLELDGHFGAAAFVGNEETGVNEANGVVWLRGYKDWSDPEAARLDEVIVASFTFAY
ncbi:MAG: hypothetical protein H6711_01225 [Myxococcales bacterium]|nr:hypothetical protein [Myxococcales bacterium]